MTRRLDQYSADSRPIARQACPWCAHSLDTVTQAHAETSEAPEAGDATVCIHCSQVSIFLLDGTLRCARPDELTADIQSVQADIRQMQARLN